MIHIDQNRLFKQIANIQREFLIGAGISTVYENALKCIQQNIGCEFIFYGHYPCKTSIEQKHCSEAIPEFQVWASYQAQDCQHKLDSDYSLSNIVLSSDKYNHFQFEQPVLLRLLKQAHPGITDLVSIPIRYQDVTQGTIGIINKDSNLGEASILEMGALFECLAIITKQHRCSQIQQPLFSKEHNDKELERSIAASSLNLTPDPLLITNCNNEILFCNAEFRRQLGYSNNDILWKNLDTLGENSGIFSLTSISQNDLQNYTEASATSVHQIPFKAVFKTKSGNAFEAETYHNNIRTANGLKCGNLYVIKSSQHLDRAKQALEIETNKFNSLLNLGIIGIAVISPEGKFIQANDYFCNILGYTQAQLQVLSWMNITHPADQEREHHFFDRIVNSKIHRHITEKRFIRSDKRQLYSKISVNSVENKDGNLIYFLVLIKDISNQKKEQEKFKIIFEQSLDPHFLCDNDKILDCNSAAIKILGCNSKREALKISPKSISPPPPDPPSIGEQKIPLVYQGKLNGIHRFDWIYQNSQGKLLNIEITLNPVHMGNKPVLLIVWRDKTSRIESERLIRDAKKVSERAIQQRDKFMSSLSLKLRTPLNSIFASSSKLADELKNQIPQKDFNALEIIRSQTKELLQSINDTEKTVKKEHNSKEVINLSITLSEICAQILPEAKQKHVKINSHLESDELLTFGNKSTIRQVIYHLLSNAIQSASAGPINVSIASELDKHIGNAIIISVDTLNEDTDQGDDKVMPASEQNDTHSPMIYYQDEPLNPDLLLTNDLANAQGGRINMQQRGNQYHHFEILFPAHIESRHGDKHLH